MKTNSKHASSVTINDEKAEEKLTEIMVSKMTLTDIQSESFKSILPQISGTLISSSLNVVIGISLAYSGILIPAIESPNSDIKATKEQTSWIASTLTLNIAIAGFFTGALMDKIGRLNTIKLSIIPMVVGWLLIALAKNVMMLLIGRILIGLAAALTSNPGAVYITEITRPDLRGSFLSFLTLTTSIGMELVYLQGTVWHWRTIAWSSIAMSIVLFLSLFFIRESPSWLMSKNREDEAKKSLEWLHKYHKQQPGEKDIVDVHFSILKKERDVQAEISEQSKDSNILLDFCKPFGYKPMLILTGLFIVQQFSGPYVLIFYAVTFFEGTGSKIDPILASNLITGSTVLISFVNVFSLKLFRKKTLMVASAVGMGVSLFISALFTKWIHEGKTVHTWVPLVFLFIYMTVAMVGMMPVPWTMAAEVFPLHLRGIGSSLALTMAAGIMFLAIQTFRVLNDALGGSFGMQLFYGTFCFGGVLFIALFVPETKGKKLSEIEEFFK